MAKHAGGHITYLVQISIVFIWTISILISDPLNYHGKENRRQSLVPTTVWLTRLKDPLKEKIAWHADALPSMPQFTVIEAHNKAPPDSIVYKYLTEHTFTEDMDFASDISQNLMSPLTRAMVMMGCYGDPLNPLNIPEMKSPEVYKMAHNISTAFMLNIMLQTWEDRHNKHDRKQAAVSEIAQFSNDRSACSCMKDFANPLLMTREQGRNQKYKYDSCLLQNLVDYTAKTDTRDREDPMKIELKLYTDFLIGYYTKENKTASWGNVSITEARTNHAAINTLMQVIGNTSVSNLKGLMDHLDARINVMYPHNKLRTPQVHNDNVDVDERLKSNPPSISKTSFSLYMDKYRSAFQVCAHDGVPQYQTKQLVLLVATKFSKLGMSFLLGAAMIGFSVLYKKMQCDETQNKSESVDSAAYVNKQTRTLLVAFCEFATRVMIIASLVVALLSISEDLGGENVSEKMTILTFTTAVWWVFASVLLVNFCSETWKLYKGTCEDKTYVMSQVSQDVCVIGGLANVGVSLLLHRGESDEYVVTACFVLFLTIGLIQHCSNLVRMMQLYTTDMLKSKITEQKPISKEQSSAVTTGIAYNRVLVLVLVAVGLLGYVMLASSSLQTWSVDVLYGYQRVRIFAICAFLIFSTFDIFFEVLVGMKYGPEAPFKDQHPRKMMWTGWVIIVALLILELHQYSSLCMSHSPDKEDMCNVFNYFFRTEPTITTTKTTKTIGSRDPNYNHYTAQGYDPIIGS